MLDIPDPLLLSKIKYSEYLQDKEDRKNIKISSKYHCGSSNNINEPISFPQK
jgi:hypothetical protein